MKKVCAILFSLALLLAGLPLSVTTACADNTPKACCSCGGHSDCCAANTSAPTSEIPAAPAPSSVQNDFNAITWIVAAWLTTPVATDRPNCFVTSTSPVASVVPLFTRDCAFLI